MCVCVCVCACACAWVCVRVCVSHPIFLQGSKRFVDAVDEFVDVFKVFGHFSGENHVDDGLPQRPVLVPV